MGNLDKRLLLLTRQINTAATLCVLVYTCEVVMYNAARKFVRGAKVTKNNFGAELVPKFLKKSVRA